MPIAPPPNNQLCTFTTATDLAARLIAIGIPVGTIYELPDPAHKYDTTDERYTDDGGEHQFVATIWGGPEQSLAVTSAMFEAKGYNYESFSKLAAVSNKTPPEAAILPLKGNIDAINANLSRQMM
jgi:hypothetical protein